MLDNADLISRLERFFDNEQDARETFETIRDICNNDGLIHDQLCPDRTTCPESNYRWLMLIVFNELVKTYGGETWTQCDEIVKGQTH